MQQELLTLLNASEKRRQHLLDLVKTVDRHKYFSSQHGKWSISQILSHLVHAEQLSLQYMKKKSLGIETAGDTGIYEDLKFFLLRLSQRLPLKYKAPKVLGEDQPPSLDLDEVTAKWNGLRTELKTFLESFEKSTLKRKVYKHAIAGRLNVMQAIRFFDEHLIHHLPQIKRQL